MKNFVFLVCFQNTSLSSQANFLIKPSGGSSLGVRIVWSLRKTIKILNAQRDFVGFDFLKTRHNLGIIFVAKAAHDPLNASSAKIIMLNKHIKCLKRATVSSTVS